MRAELHPDLNLSRCSAFVIGLEIQPQIFVPVVGAEPGRHVAILAPTLLKRKGPQAGVFGLPGVVVLAKVAAAAIP
ncbi:hypothetical protein [Streptomyces sp. NPDC001494]